MGVDYYFRALQPLLAAVRTTDGFHQQLSPPFHSFHFEEGKSRSILLLSLTRPLTNHGPPSSCIDKAEQRLLEVKRASLHFISRRNRLLKFVPL